jgi:CRISPR type I-E-associated protein CasB/Cse2
MTDNAASIPRNERKDAIWQIASAMARADFGTGPLASLRRHIPADVQNEPTFHRLITDVDDKLLVEDAPLRWATVIQAMALGTKPGEGVPTERAGKSLAAAGYSESRFARLLASHGDTFRDQVVLLARYMNGKQARFSWADLGELVLVEGWNEPRADKLRFRIARDYYRELTAMQKHAA